MNAQVALQILLRLLPSIILFATAFLVVRDARMRERWGDLLFRAGSIRAEQKADLKIQNGIRTPFLVLGVLFLLWPAWYLWRDAYAQQPLQVAPQPTAVPLPTPVPTPLPPGSITPGPTPFGTPPSLAPSSIAQPAAPAPGIAPPPAPGPGSSQAAPPPPVPLRR